MLFLEDFVFGLWQFHRDKSTKSQNSGRQQDRNGFTGPDEVPECDVTKNGGYSAKAW